MKSRSDYLAPHALLKTLVGRPEQNQLRVLANKRYGVEFFLFISPQQFFYSKKKSIGTQKYDNNDTTLWYYSPIIAINYEKVVCSNMFFVITRWLSKVEKPNESIYVLRCMRLYLCTKKKLFSFLKNNVCNISYIFFCRRVWQKNNFDFCSCVLILLRAQMQNTCKDNIPISKFVKQFPAIFHIKHIIL